jgi:hypothetical protein
VSLAYSGDPPGEARRSEMFGTIGKVETHSCCLCRQGFPSLSLAPASEVFP